MFLEKNRKRHSRLRLFTLVVITITLALLASVLVYASQTKQIVIDYKGHKIVVKTMGNTVKDVLDENKIKLNATDVVKPQLNQSVESISTITIEDARIQTGNVQSTESFTQSENSAQDKVLQLVDKSKQNQTKNESAKNIKNLKQDHVEKVVVEKCKVPFDTEKRPSSRLKLGSTKVVRQGKDGMVEKSYKIVYRNGKEVSRKLLSKKVTIKPLAQLVEYGTTATVTTSRGNTVRYSRAVEMRSTAYTACFADTGKRPGHPEFGITASGIRAKPGIVAVDPRVIPLGTRLYVESLQDGVPDYGIALAADTGGAIKGNKIDLYFDSTREVDDWGVRKVKVYVLQ